MIQSRFLLDTIPITQKRNIINTCFRQANSFLMLNVKDQIYFSKMLQSCSFQRDSIQLSLIEFLDATSSDHDGGDGDVTGDRLCCIVEATRRSNMAASRRTFARRFNERSYCDGVPLKKSPGLVRT